MTVTAESCRIDWQDYGEARRRRAITAQDKRFCEAMRRVHFPSATPPVARPAPAIEAFKKKPKTPRDMILLPRVAPLFNHWKHIAEEVATEAGITLSDLTSHRRDKAVVLARKKCWWRLQRETGMSLPQIGQRMNRDHTTIIWGIREYEKLVAASLAIAGEAALVK